MAGLYGVVIKLIIIDGIEYSRFFTGAGIFLCFHVWSLKDTVKKYPKKRRGPREGISAGPQGGSSGAFYVWGSGTDCFWGKQLQIWEGTTFAVLKYTIL